MRRNTGLLVAGALKLLAIAGAVFLERSAMGAPAVVLLPIVSILGGVSLGRGDPRLSAGLTAVFAAVNAIGFPLVLWVINRLRFGDLPDPDHLLMLATMLAVPGLIVAPAVAWALAPRFAPRIV